MHLRIKSLFRLAFLLMGVTLVVGVLIFCNFNRASIYNELAAFDLVPKPEKITELYFDNSAHLPGSATSDQVISFTFVIHDLEATDYQYVYNVYLNTNGMKHMIDSGNVLVKNEQYFAKTEKFKLLNAPGSQKVVVELANKQQSIDFWVGETAQ